MKQEEDRTLAPFSEEAQKIVLGGMYKHYKGELYKVFYIARHSETLEEMVVYQPQYGTMDIWVRPLSNFIETVIIDGQERPRFALI